jgi:hypothetical protein
MASRELEMAVMVPRELAALELEAPSRAVVEAEVVLEASRLLRRVERVPLAEAVFSLPKSFSHKRSWRDSREQQVRFAVSNLHTWQYASSK